MELKNKVAVVTGAASGIGLATCRRLMTDDLNAIIMVDRLQGVVSDSRQINEEAGRDLTTPYVGDVTCKDFRRTVFDDAKKKFGAVHLCIPAAGITRDRLSVKVDKETGLANIYPEEDFEAVMHVNLMAPIFWAMEAVASVAEDRIHRGLGRWEPEERAQGSIVLIGSVSSAGNRGQISYATAKSGLEGAQATLATEAIYHGVRCNIIHPGYTNTPMVQALGDQHIKQWILPQTQLRRLLEPAEVADSIHFLLTNSAVSGSLWVDAGWHPAA